jgi:hypothetical protein
MILWSNNNDDDDDDIYLKYIKVKSMQCMLVLRWSASSAFWKPYKEGLRRTLI